MKNFKRLFLGSLLLALLSLIALFFWWKNLRAEQLMFISGKVIDYDTGKGIAGITVVISMSKWAKTDKDWNFVITEVSAGRYKLDIARMVASVPEYYVPHSYPEYIDVPIGKNVRNIKIYLRKGATASGRVLAEDGVTPIKGAKITLMSKGTDLYGRIHSLASEAMSSVSKSVFTTDEEGRYNIKGIYAEFPFTLLVKAYGYANEVKKDLKVNYGEELTNVDFIMGRRSKAVVKGKVISKEYGTPIVKAYVFIQKEDWDNFDSGRALTDSKGEFQVKGLTPGFYEISVVPHESDRNEYDLDTGDIKKFYISEGKENYVEIKMALKKKQISTKNKGYSKNESPRN